GIPRLADPLFDAFGLAFGDQRTNLCGVLEGMPDAQLACQFRHALGHFVAYRFLGVNPLDGDADLARISERARDAFRDGFIEVGIRLEYDGRVRPQLESDPFHACEIPNALSHIGTAGERDHGNARVESKGVANYSARTGDDVQGSGRQTRIEKN